MPKKMLIDATHKEETRVAVTDGNKLLEYDYESQSRKPLKGNIFLAKVTRVEPSLQAAFVNYGGNRHGFLPFSEIHPDYFKIPVADRDALIAEQEALLQEHDEEEQALEEGEAAEDSDGLVEAADILDDDAEEDSATPEEDGDASEEADEDESGEDAADDAEADPAASEEAEGDQPADEEKSAKQGADKGNEKRKPQRGRGRGRGGRGRAQYRNRNVEVVGGEGSDGEQRFRFNLRRKYKIQEVVKRGQIMLIQVNKEERGNKGAAVGSYLSLPGRYCVLMPNSPRAGGVSRKIANNKDRARMRDIVKSLEVPKGMSVIVRTAGVTRTKAEIKRDLDYLMRLWNKIRELTLESTAPSMVYEEADLIKRSVRDLYTRDVEEIHVAGKDGYKIAKDFMKMMIPSHVKKVKQYESGQIPLFNRYQVESQINEIGQPEVRLKSGGSLVINPTEALVSIDVNSGKATKGRHIEETALRTNLEAAEEVARQLKLRDLGGLVVIDFIDMENRRNNGKVERRMKDALSTDRARVQVGRISSFGLMELSRQRLSPSLTEAQFEQCKECNGIGMVRTDDAMSILVLRALEEEGIRGRAAQVIVQIPNSVALYILNHKRKKLAQIEEHYNLQVLIRVNEELPASEYRIEVSKPAVKGDADNADDEQNESVQVEAGEEEGERKETGRRRGRRGGRSRNNRGNENAASEENAQTSEEKAQDTNVEGEEKPSKPKRKPRKKPEASKEEDGAEKAPSKSRGRKKKEAAPDADGNQKADAPKAANDDAASAEGEEKPSKPKRKPRKKAEDAKVENKPEEAAEKKKPAAKPKAAAKPAKKEAPKAESKQEEEAEPVARQYETVNQAPKQKKKGWWNRLVE